MRTHLRELGIALGPRRTTPHWRHPLQLLSPVGSTSQDKSWRASRHAVRREIKIRIMAQGGRGFSDERLRTQQEDEMPSRKTRDKSLPR